ncbi:MAG: hydantoinase/oxoprolinase family protein, partial [Chloroflexi bacterium]|nr:hydantoinase/oxoprolinase family protein [Chloroflexota bacterium]
VCLIQNGTGESTLRTRVLGHTLAVPTLEVYSVGAGGGSIAWLDGETRLKVGPRSSGSDPGPVCYGRGGVEPTVTDADVVLGYLDPDNFLGGKIRLSHEKAYQAIKERFADKIGLSVVEAANGIVQIVQQNMINAMRVLTVERGIDPRDSILMAFGGAGGAHAAAMFQDLGIRKVVVPNNASVLSSFGLVVSNLRHSYSASYRSLIDDLDLEKASSLFADMEHRARRTLESEGMTGERIQIEPSIDMSYIGQLHELNVPVSSTAITPALVEEAKLSFTRKYESMYGMTEHLPIQVVTFRVEGIGLVPQPILKEHPIGTEDASGALKGHRPGFFDEADGFVSTPVYDAACIQAGNQVEGPAIVEYDTTTLVVRPRQRIAWDRWLNAIITQDNKEV